MADDFVKKSFEFGRGTSQPRSHFRTFLVPAGSSVGVATLEMSVDPPDATIPVIIEVRQASAASIGSTGPDGPLIDVKAANAPANIVTFLPTYTSNFGCPSTWRVRVRSAVGPDVPAKVSGTILFEFRPPGFVALDMTGADTQHLDPHDSANRILRARLGSLHSIAGTGEFHIRAKWHTDPLDLLNIGSYHRLTVGLLRPNGTVANSENGFSQHAPADKVPKVDFRYTVTPQDTAMAGDWGLQITNDSSVRIVDFDVNRGLDPNPLLSDFTSTFRASCG